MIIIMWGQGRGLVRERSCETISHEVEFYLFNSFFFSFMFPLTLRTVRAGTMPGLLTLLCCVHISVHGPAEAQDICEMHEWKGSEMLTSTRQKFIFCEET